MLEQELADVVEQRRRLERRMADHDAAEGPAESRESAEDADGADPGEDAEASRGGASEGGAEPDGGNE